MCRIVYNLVTLGAESIADRNKYDFLTCDNVRAKFRCWNSNLPFVSKYREWLDESEVKRHHLPMVSCLGQGTNIGYNRSGPL